MRIQRKLNSLENCACTFKILPPRSVDRSQEPLFQGPDLEPARISLFKGKARSVCARAAWFCPWTAAQALFHLARARSSISSLPPFLPFSSLLLALLPDSSLPFKDLGIMTPTSEMEEVTFSKLGNQAAIVVREQQAFAGKCGGSNSSVTSRS